MALNFDFKDIADESVCYVNTGNKDAEGNDLVRIHPTLENLIWTTMCIETPSIDEKNLARWVKRCAQFEAATGSPLFYDNECQRVPVTADMLRPYIGLRTNAGNMSEREWVMKLGRIVANKGR